MRDNETGSVIVFSLIIMLIFMVLITGLSSLIVNEIHISSYETNSTKAFYIAEAGIEYAVTVLKEMEDVDSSEWASTDNPEQKELVYTNRINDVLSGGELIGVTGEKESDTGYITLVSNAAFNETTKAITVLYDYGYQSNGAAFDYSMVSRGDMTLGDSSYITGNEDGGDIYSNEDIVSEGTLNLVDCEIMEFQEDLIYPIINLEEIRSKATNTDLSNIGDNITYIGPDNEAMVDGSVTLASSDPLYVNGEGIMLIDGNLYVHDRLYFNNESDEFFILIVTGDIDINDIFYGNGLIYSYGNVYINDVDNFMGSVIAGATPNEGDSGVYNEGSEGILTFVDQIDIIFDNSYVELFIKYDISVNDKDGNKLIDSRLISWSEQG